MGYQQTQATVIGEDNQSGIKLTTDLVIHKGSNHIDTRYHFPGEVDEKSVELGYKLIRWQPNC